MSTDDDYFVLVAFSLDSRLPSDNDTLLNPFVTELSELQFCFFVQSLMQLFQVFEEEQLRISTGLRAVVTSSKVRKLGEEFLDGRERD